MNKGLFISIEGPNGVGKSSIADLLTEQIRNLGIPVLYTTEPTNTELGQWIRNLESRYSGATYACLIAADRYCHIENEIIPALEKGITIITARFVESSLVLQRMDNLDLEFIWNINKKIIKPDLSVILTASPEILRSRMLERKFLSRFEQRHNNALELKYYLDAANFLINKGFNILILDNETHSIEENVSSIKIEVLKLLYMQGGLSGQ